MEKYKYISVPSDKWRKFVDIAFNNSKYFSLTLFFGVAPKYDYIINELDYWLIDVEIVWGEYEKRFYECNSFTKRIIFSIKNIDMFGKGKYPDDLCFYSEAGMWFENISHESDSYIILPECNVMDKLKENCFIIF
ncbi:MAG: hypothetical protein K2J32_08625 [Ruminococcus sp.]|nr:hypothetical protein [Ruminococcus sp.]